MREYILTEQERKIIQIYLETGIKAEGYRVLRHRCYRLDKTKILSDLALIDKFVKTTK